jgi:hypothetical protein
MVQLPGLPGTYRGSIIIPDIDVDQTVNVAVVAVGALGRVWSSADPTQIHLIKFRPLQPHLISPSPGSHAGGQVTIEGYTEPYATVNCTIGAQPAGGWSTAVTLYADGEGHFLSNPVQLGGAGAVTYSLSAQASQDSRQAPPATVFFAR